MSRNAILDDALALSTAQATCKPLLWSDMTRVIVVMNMESHSYKNSSKSLLIIHGVISLKREAKES